MRWPRAARRSTARSRTWPVLFSRKSSGNSSSRSSSSSSSDDSSAHTPTKQLLVKKRGEELELLEEEKEHDVDEDIHASSTLEEEDGANQNGGVGGGVGSVGGGVVVSWARTLFPCHSTCMEKNEITHIISEEEEEELILQALSTSGEECFQEQEQRDDCEAAIINLQSNKQAMKEELLLEGKDDNYKPNEDETMCDGDCRGTSWLKALIPSCHLTYLERNENSVKDKEKKLRKNVKEKEQGSLRKKLSMRDNERCEEEEQRDDCEDHHADNREASASTSESTSASAQMMMMSAIYSDKSLWRNETFAKFSDWQIEVVRRPSGKVDTYKVHKLIVGAGSGKSLKLAKEFQKINNSNDPSKNNTTRLDLEEDLADRFPDVLDWIYLPSSEAHEYRKVIFVKMMILAEYLDIPSLRDKLQDQYIKQEDLTVEDLADIWGGLRESKLEAERLVARAFDSIAGIVTGKVIDVIRRGSESEMDRLLEELAPVADKDLVLRVMSSDAFLKVAEQTVRKVEIDIEQKWHSDYEHLKESNMKRVEQAEKRAMEALTKEQATVQRLLKQAEETHAEELESMISAHKKELDRLTRELADTSEMNKRLEAEKQEALKKSLQSSWYDGFGFDEVSLRLGRFVARFCRTHDAVGGDLPTRDLTYVSGTSVANGLLQQLVDLWTRKYEALFDQASREYERLHQEVTTNGKTRYDSVHHHVTKLYDQQCKLLEMSLKDNPCQSLLEMPPLNDRHGSKSSSRTLLLKYWIARVIKRREKEQSSSVCHRSGAFSI